MGLKADPSNRPKIEKGLNVFVEKLTKKHIEAFQYVLEDFINNARDHSFAGNTPKGAYTDRTRNLKGSTGGFIALNGKIIYSDVTGEPDGVAQANNLAREVIRQNKTGLVIVVTAGMEYAAAVEAKGYDVITASSVEASKLLKKLIKEAL